MLNILVPEVEHCSRILAGVRRMKPSHAARHVRMNWEIDAGSLACRCNYEMDRAIRHWTALQNNATRMAVRLVLLLLAVAQRVQRRLSERMI
jgi:hypothetical protein